MSAHLFIIHFPVSLILVAATLDLIGVAMTEPGLRDWAWRFLIAAAFAVFFAFATGEGARLAALAGGGVPFSPLETHQEWGTVGIWGVIGAALLRTLWRNRISGFYGWLNLFLLLLTAGLLIVITVTGSMVRHGG